MGDDRVVVDFTLHATGRSSGIEVEQKAFQVWTLVEDKAIGLELFTDREQAEAYRARCEHRMSMGWEELMGSQTDRRFTVVAMVVAARGCQTES